MSDFDPIRAQGEVLTGYVTVQKIVVSRARAAEQALAEAEADFNSIKQVEAFINERVDSARAKLRALQDEAEAEAAKGTT